MEIEITDVVGLSKPLTRLVEVMAQGFGAVSRQYLTIRNADAEAYKIRKIAETIKDVAQQHQLPVVHDDGTTEIWQKPEDQTLILGETTLDARAHRRVDFQERKRQANLESVTSAAAAELAYEEGVPDEHPDEDWITRFFNSAQDVSSADMQRIWGRLLAGEIKKPGSFSLRTLEFIRNLSPTEAGLIDRALRLALAPFDSKVKSFLYSGGGYLKESAGITISDLLYLDELGVVNSKEFGFNITMKRVGNEYAITHGDHVLLLRAGKEKVKFTLRIYNISSVGGEIVDLLSVNTDFEYLRTIGREFIKSNGTAVIIKVKKRYSDGSFDYTTIEEIAETPQ